MNQVFLEYRWYQKSDTQKWFIGPHIGFGMFTLQKPDFAIIYDYWEEKSGRKRLDVPDDEYQSGRALWLYGWLQKTTQ